MKYEAGRNGHGNQRGLLERKIEPHDSNALATPLGKRLREIGTKDLGVVSKQLAGNQASFVSIF